MALVAVAPCPCPPPGGVQPTPPGLISLFWPFHSCPQPVPDVTIRIWPAGWVCHAERAPGAKITLPPAEAMCSLAANNGPTITAPVDSAAAPVGRGRDPFCAKTRLSAAGDIVPTGT